MEKIIAMCGIVCSDCVAYIATQKDDDAKRAEVARKWSEMFKSDIKQDDINCDGCTIVGGRHFNYCSMCEIRACGEKMGVVNCAYCEEYICERLDGFFKMAPDAKGVLDGVRANL